MFISEEKIKKLAHKVRIKLNDKQIDLLKKEFENIVFKRLNILKKFDFNNMKPLRYLNLKNVIGLREDDIEVKDIVGKNKDLIKNNRFNKDLYLISNKIE